MERVDSIQSTLFQILQSMSIKTAKNKTKQGQSRNVIAAVHESRKIPQYSMTSHKHVSCTCVFWNLLINSKCTTEGHLKSFQLRCTISAPPMGLQRAEHNEIKMSLKCTYFQNSFVSLSSEGTKGCRANKWAAKCCCDLHGCGAWRRFYGGKCQYTPCVVQVQTCFNTKTLIRPYCVEGSGIKTLASKILQVAYLFNSF